MHVYLYTSLHSQVQRVEKRNPFVFASGRNSLYHDLLCSSEDVQQRMGKKSDLLIFPHTLSIFLLFLLFAIAMMGN